MRCSKELHLGVENTADRLRSTLDILFYPARLRCSACAFISWLWAWSSGWDGGEVEKWKLWLGQRARQLLRSSKCGSSLPFIGLYLHAPAHRETSHFRLGSCCKVVLCRPSQPYQRSSAGHFLCYAVSLDWWDSTALSDLYQKTSLVGLPIWKGFRPPTQHW